MKKLVKFIVVPMMCLAANFSSAANIKDYPTVAVMDFGNKAITSRGLRGHDMTMATEYAIYQLSACGWFDLIDYEQLSTIAKMHSINMSGMIDPSSAAQMGKISGAQFMVIGNVTGLTTKENVVGLRAHNAKADNAQHVVNANVTVRIVDVETGRIVAAGIGKGSSTSTMTEIGFTKYRNRKVETENIYNSVANTVIDEYNQNKVNSSNKESDYNINTHTMSDKNNKSYDYKSTENKEGIRSDLNEKNYKKDYSTEASSLEQESNSSKIQKSSETYSATGDKELMSFTSIEGDINEDGQIDEKDFVILENYFLYEDPKDYFNKNNADMDGDGEITIKDLWKLRTLVNGLYPQTYKHTVGDVSSRDAYGEVDEKDVELLKNYLSGDRSKYLFLLAADINDDGYITLTDLSLLKNIVSTGKGANHRMVSTIYHLLPQKYYDYNNNHGIKVENQTGELTKTGSVSGSSNSNSEGNKNSTKKEKIENIEWYKTENTSIDNLKNSMTIKESTDDSSNKVDQTINSSDVKNENLYSNETVNYANNIDTFNSSNKSIHYEREAMDYKIVIGTVEVSDVQVRNAISKAVRDAIYGKTGLMTTLNNGKQIKIKTGF